MQHCVDKIKRETEADVNDLREQIKTNAQSIDRLCSEKSNGNACIKNDIKTLKSELKCLSDDLVSKVDNCKLEWEIEKTSSLLKRVNKIEKENCTVTTKNIPHTQTQIDQRCRSIPSTATCPTTSVTNCTSSNTVTSKESFDDPIVTFSNIVTRQSTNSNPALKTNTTNINRS